MISPRRLPIFDGHNDVLLRLYSGLNLSCRAQKFEIRPPRLRSNPGNPD
jgi:hypothetical protein